MASLKDLYVLGSARILNKLYCDNVAVAGTSSFGAITATSLSSTGTLSVTGASTLSGAVTVGSTISSTGNISSSGTVTGATGLFSTNGNLTLNSKLAAQVSNNALVLGGGFTNGVSISRLAVNNATIDDGTVSGNFVVNGVLESNEWRSNIVQSVGGDMYLGPTFQAMGTTTISCTAATATTVSFTLSDSNITGVTYGSATWYKDSEIMFSGTVTGNAGGNPKIVFSSARGTVTANMGSSANKLQITVNYKDANSYFQSSGTALSYENVSVMMYRIKKDGNLYPIGIHLKSYSSDKSSFIDVYGGTSNTPSARLGLLNNLGLVVNNENVRDWGLYTHNGYFEGSIVSQNGIIGGWTLDDTNLQSGTWGNSGSVLMSSGYAPTGASKKSIGGSGTTDDFTWAFTAGDAFGVTTDGTVYASNGHFSGEVTANAGDVGGWNIGDNILYSEYEYSNTHTNSYIFMRNFNPDMVDETMENGLYNIHASSTGNCTLTIVYTWDDKNPRTLDLSTNTSSMTMYGTAHYEGPSFPIIIDEDTVEADPIYEYSVNQAGYNVYPSADQITQETIGGDYPSATDPVTVTVTFNVTLNISRIGDYTFYAKCYDANGVVEPSSVTITSNNISFIDMKQYGLPNNVAFGISSDDGGDMKSKWYVTHDGTMYVNSLKAERIDNPYLYGDVRGQDFIIGRTVTQQPYFTFGNVRNDYTSGGYSFRAGLGEVAQGFCSVAMGSLTKATGTYSVALGMNTQSTDIASVSMGADSQALDSYSIAMGNGPIASGLCSTAIGYKTVVTSNYNTVIGKYNKATVYNGEYTNVGNYAFIIGNGTADTTAGRSNALTVDWSGNLIASGSLSGTSISTTGAVSAASVSATGDISANGLGLRQFSGGKIILGVQTVNIQTSSGVAANTAANATGSLTAVSGADGYWVFPVRTFQFNIVSTAASVSGTTITIGLYNISGGSHTLGVTCLVMAYKNIVG